LAPIRTAFIGFCVEARGTPPNFDREAADSISAHIAAGEVLKLLEKGLGCTLA
jgi:hypothetical protein